MRNTKGPWVTEDQGDCNGAIKTILMVWNELLHTCNGAIKTKGKMRSTAVIINLTKLTIGGFKVEKLWPIIHPY